MRHANGTFDEDENRNILAITDDPATGSSTTHWLTSFAPKGVDVVGEPRVVEMAPDTFAVLFTATKGTGLRTEYRLIDASATVLGSAGFDGVRFAAGAEPIVLGPRLLWLASAGDSAYVYGLDLSNPVKPALLG